MPFFFYSQRTGVRPEAISLTPGEGYPVPDANRDINFPQIGNPQAQGFMINMISMLGQMEERVTHAKIEKNRSVGRFGYFNLPFDMAHGRYMDRLVELWNVHGWNVALSSWNEHRWKGGQKD